MPDPGKNGLSPSAADAELIAGARREPVRHDDLDQSFALHGEAGLVLQRREDPPGSDVDHLAG